VIELSPDATYYTTTVTLTNTSDDLVEDVRFMRSFDPDQDLNFFGTYNTLNDVLSQPDGSSDLAIAQATGPRSGISINLIGIGDDFRASNFGFANRNPYESSAYDAPSDRNGVSVDAAIALTMDVGDLAVGQSETRTYVTSMNGSGAASDMFVGTGGADTINVGAGDDFVFALGGSDTITLGAGDDVLYYGHGDGIDTVTDFTAGVATADRIDVTSFDLTEFADILDRAYQEGDGVVIDFGSGDILRLSDLDVGQLTSDDFIFV
jgi:Ca2+-binding RTX toxin-like protein